ncbi:acyl-CoA-binding protein, ACBP [Pseudohyphozyma bogoriensis]|nr:acyl-CoA-binding protein, ACBP [Pseudohyphozyma bogoriensis]
MTSITSSRLSTRPPHPFNSDPDWVHARFERAVDIVQSVYKQATEGDVKSSRPGMLDVLGRAKWDAWNKRKGVSEDDAKRAYVEGLLKILRGYSDRTLAVELIHELENFTTGPAAGFPSTGDVLSPAQSLSSYPHHQSQSFSAYPNTPQGALRPISAPTPPPVASTSAQPYGGSGAFATPQQQQAYQGQQLLYRPGSATATQPLAQSLPSLPLPQSVPSIPTTAGQLPLDIALNRIQASLTSLSDRLSSLEAPVAKTSSSTSTTTLLRQSFVSLLVLLRLRAPTAASARFKWGQVIWRLLKRLRGRDVESVFRSLLGRGEARKRLVDA